MKTNFYVKLNTEVKLRKCFVKLCDFVVRNFFLLLHVLGEAKQRAKLLTRMWDTFSLAVIFLLK